MAKVNTGMRTRDARNRKRGKKGNAEHHNKGEVQKIHSRADERVA
jgi:hypothetical protein